MEDDMGADGDPPSVSKRGDLDVALSFGHSQVASAG